MQGYESLLKNDERAVFALRKLYSDNGYKQFKMSKFEEYDLYVKNKDFLVSEGVITFNDTNGKLLALKPDVTLSILKHYSGEKGNVEKYYYNENVYRVSESSHTYKEIMQSGIECIGDINEKDCLDVIGLAFERLALINDDFIVNLSSASFFICLNNVKNTVACACSKIICMSTFCGCNFFNCFNMTAA